MIAKTLTVLRQSTQSNAGVSLESLEFPRIAHSLGSAIHALAGSEQTKIESIAPALDRRLVPETSEWQTRCRIRIWNSLD